MTSPTTGAVVAPGPQGAVLVHRRVAELDGYRGIAAIAVVVFHVYQFVNVDHFLYFGTPAYTVLNSLDATVPLFFVLTAFLLFEPIAWAAIHGGPPVSARRFLGRRAIRLLPVYYVAVTVVWFIRQQNLPGDWRDLLEHLTFTQVFDETRIFYTIGPAWSLSVEVFFYLGLAVAAVGLARGAARITGRRGRIRLLAAFVAVVAGVALGWRAWSFAVGNASTLSSFTTWFGPVANFDSFAVGMAVAVLVAALGGRRPLGHRGRWLLRLAALVILVAAFATRAAETWSAVYFASICSVGFGCVVAAAVLGSPPDRWAAALSWRPLLWLGMISYSVYLWHEPIMLMLRGWGLVQQRPDQFLATTISVVTVSVLVGWLSYAVIERPTSRLRHLFTEDRQS